MAVRLSQQRLRLLDGNPDNTTDPKDAEQVSALPSVRRLTAIGATPARSPEDDDAPARRRRSDPHRIKSPS